MSEEERQNGVNTVNDFFDEGVDDSTVAPASFPEIVAQEYDGDKPDDLFDGGEQPAAASTYEYSEEAEDLYGDKSGESASSAAEVVESDAEKTAEEEKKVDPEEIKRLRKEEKEKKRQARKARKKEVQEGIRKGAEKVKEVSSEVKKEIEADDRELKETSKKNRRALMGIAVLLVVVGVVIFLFSDRFYNTVKGRSSYVLDEMDVTVNYIEGNTTLILHDGNLLRCSQDGLMAINSNGGVVYDIPFTMSAPYAVSAGDYVSVADRLGMSLIVVRNGQTEAAITTESNILLNTVNEVGQACVVLSATNGNLVNLYSTSGEVLMQRRTYATTDGLPVAIALSPDGSRMATVYVNYTGSVLTSIVTLFDLTESGSSLIDRIIGSISFDGCIISDIEFKDEGLFYVGTDRMGELSTDSAVNTIWEKVLSYEIKTLAMSDDFYVIQYGSGQAGTAVAVDYNVVCYSYNGEVLSKYNITDCTYVDAWGDTLIYASSRVYYGVSSTGKAKWIMNTGDTYGRMVAYTNGKTVAATRNGKIHFYKVSLRGVDGENVN